MSEIGKEILKTMSTLFTTAFAFVAGLAWNGAIEELINTFISKGNALLGLFVYAIVVTILAVIVTVIMGRLIAKAGIKEDEE